MANYTRGEFITEVRTLLNEATAAFYTNAQIAEWLDQGQREVASKALAIQVEGTITTVKGTLSYSYTGLACIALIFNYKYLTQITPKQAGHLKYQGDDPQYWFDWANKVYILPVPKAVHTITSLLASDSTDFASDSSTSAVQTPYQYPIILYATYRGLLKDRQYSKASQLYSMFLNEIQYTREDLGHREPDTKQDFSLRDDRITRT